MGLWAHDDLLQIQLNLYNIAIDKFRLVEAKFLCQGQHRTVVAQDGADELPDAALASNGDQALH